MGLQLAEPQLPEGFVPIRSHVRYWAPGSVGPDQMQPIVDFNQTWVSAGGDINDQATPYLQLRRRAAEQQWNPAECPCGPVVTTTARGVRVAGRLGNPTLLEWEESGVHFALVTHGLAPHESLRFVSSLAN